MSRYSSDNYDAIAEVISLSGMGNHFDPMQHYVIFQHGESPEDAETEIFDLSDNDSSITEDHNNNSNSSDEVESEEEDSEPPPQPLYQAFTNSKAYNRLNSIQEGNEETEEGSNKTNNNNDDNEEVIEGEEEEQNDLYEEDEYEPGSLSYQSGHSECISNNNSDNDSDTDYDQNDSENEDEFRNPEDIMFATNYHNTWGNQSFNVPELSSIEGNLFPSEFTLPEEEQDRIHTKYYQSQTHNRSRSPFYIIPPEEVTELVESPTYATLSPRQKELAQKILNELSKEEQAWEDNQS